MAGSEKKPVNPPQHQDRQPGREAAMVPQPVYIDPDYQGSGKLKDKVAIITGGSSFGSKVPLGRPAQPSEIAPSYVFLASRDASYMTGQVLHPNGGENING